jgi:hypothetical protein
MVRFTIGTGPVKVGNNRRDPDSVESHVLDIIKLVDDTLVSAPTVLLVACVACRTRVVGSGESIRYKLPARVRLPSRYISRRSRVHTWYIERLFQSLAEAANEGTANKVDKMKRRNIAQGRNWSGGRK